MQTSIAVECISSCIISCQSVASDAQSSPVLPASQAPCSLPVTHSPPSMFAVDKAQSHAAAVLAVAVFAGVALQNGWPVMPVAGVALASLAVGAWCARLESRLHQLVQSCSAIEVTSQVVATRANANEWRQRLSFGAQWHKCRPQSAYFLWQQGLLTVPAIPASQWYWKPGGQDLAAEDQNLADRELPQSLLQLYKFQAMLGAAHEKEQRRQLGQLTFSAEDQVRLAKYNELYNQFRQVHQTTQFNFDQHGDQLNQFVAQLGQVMQSDDWLCQ